MRVESPFPCTQLRPLWRCTPLPAQTGFTFCHPQTMKMGGCSPPHLMWALPHSARGVPGPQVPIGGSSGHFARGAVSGGCPPPRTGPTDPVLMAPLKRWSPEDDAGLLLVGNDQAFFWLAMIAALRCCAVAPPSAGWGVRVAPRTELGEVGGRGSRLVTPPPPCSIPLPRPLPFQYPNPTPLNFSEGLSVWTKTYRASIASCRRDPSSRALCSLFPTLQPLPLPEIL